MFQCQSFPEESDASPLARCHCCIETGSHFSQWRFLLHRTVAKTQPLRLCFENGATSEPSKVRHRGSSTRQNHSRSRRRLLPQGTGSVPSVPPASLPETWFTLCKGGGRRVPSGLL